MEGGAVALSDQQLERGGTNHPLGKNNIKLYLYIYPFCLRNQPTRRPRSVVIAVLATPITICICLSVSLFYVNYSQTISTNINKR